jgi:hypothetical protein
VGRSPRFRWATRTPSRGDDVRLLVEPSTIGDADVVAAREQGWSDRVLADLVALVALNQLTGSFNLLAGLGVEDAETQVT